MKAFVTGITGFVGAHLAEHLEHSGDEVLGCARRVRPSPARFAWDIAEPLREDSSAFSQLAAFAPAAIYHLAALSVPVECGRDEPTEAARQVNVGGTEHVLEVARRLPSRPKVLLVSSCHVYAPVTAEQPVVDETAELGPRRGYGMTKLAAEQAGRSAFENSGLPVIIARAFHHSGPGQLPPLMLPEWAQQLVEPGNPPMRVHTLDSWLDLSDVRDVVRAYRCLIEQGQAEQAYNIGSGRNLSTGQILAEFFRLLGHERPVQQLRPGSKQEPVADITKITTATDWRPQRDWRQTVSDTLDFWQQQTSEHVNGETA